MLSATNKKQRVQYCVDGIDKSHGGDKLKFRLDKNSFHVDESWFYGTQDKLKVLMIEDMDVLIAPKVKH